MTKSVKQKKTFNDWWTSPPVKKAVGAIYSLGASVVIVGALFKILHLPGATEMLFAGMMTEAVLFAIGIFDAPHKDFHWDNLFPNLVEKEGQPIALSNGIGNTGGTGIGGGSHVGASGISTPMDAIPEEEIKKLQESIKNMTKTASQLSDLSKAAVATDNYANKLDEASAAAAGYAEKQEELKTISAKLATSYEGVANEMASVQDNTKDFAQKALTINTNLNAINSAYELQLKNVQNQSAELQKQEGQFKNISSRIETLSTAINASAQNMNSYTQVTEQLSKNVSELNNVYGNMLNSLKA